MSHDSANEQARQLPMPSRQHVEEYVLQQSQALVPLAQRRGKPATLTALHLCLGVVLCGLEGFGSPLKLWRGRCLGTAPPLSPGVWGELSLFKPRAPAPRCLRLL